MADLAPFAVFVLAPATGGWAATTRAADRGEAGRIGLPGGKVDPGESPVHAAIREAAEEGWFILWIDDEPFHVAEVDGRQVWWFAAGRAVRLASFKEAGRIEPITVSLTEIASSGYGNDDAVAAFERRIRK